jgi:uncharacterized membrane protein YcfT
MDWMDTLRGGAVVAVVVLHSQLTTSAVTGASLEPLRSANEVLALVRMPLLMVLSGVLLSRSLAKGLRRHYVGKVRAILWPYAVWITFDLTHVMVDCALAGRPLPWHMLAEVFYDPPGYLWFLAYLFVFHVLAGLMTPGVRSLAVPVVLVLAAANLFAGVGEGGTERFLWLFPCFLFGDLLARLLPGRVPASLAAGANRISLRPLATVGRASIVYYVVHMLVVVYAVPLLWHGLGVRNGWLVWATTLAAALGAGYALSRVQHRKGWRWLFAWPAEARWPGDAGERRASHDRTAPGASDETTGDFGHRSGTMSLT